MRKFLPVKGSCLFVIFFAIHRVIWPISRSSHWNEVAIKHCYPQFVHRLKTRISLQNINRSSDVLHLLVLPIAIHKTCLSCFFSRMPHPVSSLPASSFFNFPGHPTEISINFSVIIINLFSVGIKIKDLMSKIATELTVTNKIQLS